MNKKLLIIGAGVEQIPAILMARDMGIYTITSDYNPDAPGMHLADSSYVVSTDDFKGNLNIAEKEKIDGVMTICSETGIPVIGKICDSLNLTGISEDTAIKSTDKESMNEMMRKYDVDIPARKIVSSLNEAIEFTSKFQGPWVLKPSDSSGQRGISFFDSTLKLKDLFDEAKKYASNRKVLIDQFVSGKEINVTAVVHDKTIHILSLADRITLPPPHFGIAVTHSAPPGITDEQKNQVTDSARRAIHAIGLDNGIAYPQIVVTEEGPKLIEIASRMPGGYNREMALYLSGVDMIRAQILISLGLEFDIDEIRESEIYPSAGVKLLTSVDFPELVGKEIKAIKGQDQVMELNGIKACHFHLKKSDLIPELTNSTGRFAAIVAVGETKKQTLSLLEKAASYIKIIT
ncbi:ATP-grasp domain-containing protein [Bacteroidota bacterium]